MIFVDTSFWVALRNRRDDRHAQAVRLLEEFGNVGLVTTNHVLGETWTYLNRKAGHASAVDFLDSLASSPAGRCALRHRRGRRRRAQVAPTA